MSSEKRGNTSRALAAVFVRVSCTDNKTRLLNLDRISYLEPNDDELGGTRVFMVSKRSPLLIESTIDQFIDALDKCREQLNSSET